LDLFGRTFALLWLGADPPDPAALERAAADRGLPPSVADLRGEAVERAYERPLVPVRPGVAMDYRRTRDAGSIVCEVPARSNCPGTGCGEQGDGNEERTLDQAPSLYTEPKQNFIPAMWYWEDGRAALDAAERLINTELAERWNRNLFNPVEGYSYATVRTLEGAYQMILPGETACSHRHTPNALRPVLEGESAYTIDDDARLERSRTTYS